MTDAETRVQEIARCIEEQQPRYPLAGLCPPTLVVTVDGGERCRYPGLVEITGLPEADPALIDRLLDDLEGIVATGALGVDGLEPLREAELWELDPQNRMVRAMLDALDGPDNPNSLRRLLEGGDFSRLELPIDHVMATEPKVLHPSDLAVDAHRLLRENRIDNAPVIDDERRPVGLLDVQDLIEVGI